jgi:cysteine synthase B
MVGRRTGQMSSPESAAPTSRAACGVGLLDAVGGTPLLELPRVGREVPGLRLLAKAEQMNPCGSVKDRPVRAMLVAGLASGRLTTGKTILEATSGNTGIANAMLGRALGFPVTLFLPANVSPERRAILRACGAELVLTDPLEGTDGAIRAARRTAQQKPATYFYPDQYSNPGNWRAHFETTGPEIWAQSRGRVTHFVAGLGTSGTFVGVTRFLKERDESIRCVSVEPEGPIHGLEGMKHMASSIVPPIYDRALADDRIAMATEEAYAMCRRLARDEGVFVGPSSGANVAAALRAARGAGSPATVVTVLCDGGDRYLSEDFWKEP